MKRILMVVDVQNDFISDSRLVPDCTAIISGVRELLAGFRNHRMPILHAHYVTEPDGRGLKEHHRKEGRPRCLRGTKGAEPHHSAVCREGEYHVTKHSYSVFSSPDCEEHLKGLGIDTVVICGLYTHACIRQTALDALDKGYRVHVARDAIGSYDPLHADLTRDYLSERGVEFPDNNTLLGQFIEQEKQTDPRTVSVFNPEACIEGRWISGRNATTFEIRNPAKWKQVLGHTPESATTTVETAVAAAHRAQEDWIAVSLEERMSAILRWSKIIESKADQLLPLMINEVGKPVSACRVEMELLRESLRVMGESFTSESLQRMCLEADGQTVLARRCPVGVISIITPWNNPVFLPACKIAAAIGMGNGVVWKPSIPCTRTSMLVMETLLEAGIPAGLVNMVTGGARTARSLISQPLVRGVTLTGSVETGRQVASACGGLLKPLQAELGGNNAAIVTSQCDLGKVADLIAKSAFAYAGQACTATRRVIVESEIKEDFIGLLHDSTRALKIGDPRDEATIIGPVISRSHQSKIEQCLEQAGDRARILEVALPNDLEASGCWLAPRIIDNLELSDPLVQRETFAPIVVIQTAGSFQEAIHLCNQVPNGLISSIFCEDEAKLCEFRDDAESGVIQLNRPSRSLQMEAPFCGWKDSGFGPPEHGVWDLDFYTKWQAVYRNNNP